ncbi:MAG: type II secretion system protein GspG [Planctomycetaceae bacterium]|nr:type II secretion system protein GspG [Planctomycetaceae bacterium]
MNQSPGGQSPNRGPWGCIVGLIVALLAVGLVVVLSAAFVAWIGFRGVQSSALSEATRSQIDMLENAVELYQLNLGSLPPNLDALLTAPADAAAAEKWKGPYLHMPVPADPWGKPYQYEILGQEDFRIWSAGPDGITPSPDDIKGSR